MTNLQLLEAIGMIDEETVLDAEQGQASEHRRAHHRVRRQITALAACVCLLIGGAVFANLGGWGKALNGSGGDAALPTYAASTTISPGGTTAATVTTSAPTDMTTTAYTQAPATTTTAMATTTCAAEPEIAIPKDGLLVYYEDFNDYGDTELAIGVPAALGWRTLTTEINGVYSESDAAFAFREGRLYFDNDDTVDGPLTTDRDQNGNQIARSLIRGKNAYYSIAPLDDAYMMSIVMGKYTLQYDVTYTASATLQTRASIITELSEDGQCYNEFAFRISGLGSHQCHFYGSWKTFSAYDPAVDLNPAADDAAGSEGTPLLTKLLGLDWAEYGERPNFENVTVTIRLQWDPEMGHHVYMKTAEMTEFVKVSEPSLAADAPMYIGWDGYAVAFKICGAIDGYLDNILLWTGWGEAPDLTEPNYQPVG